MMIRSRGLLACIPEPRSTMITCIIVLALLCLLVATDPAPGESDRPVS